MSAEYGEEWKTAVTVVQCVRPPAISTDAEAMTVVVEYPPGSRGAPRGCKDGRVAVGGVAWAGTRGVRRRVLMMSGLVEKVAGMGTCEARVHRPHRTSAKKVSAGLRFRCAARPARGRR